MLILLRVPYFQGDASDLPYITIPLGMVLNGQWIMTICRYDHELLHEFVVGKVRGLATAKRNRFILHMLLSAANKYLSNPAWTSTRSLERAGRSASDVQSRTGRSLGPLSIRKAWSTSQPRRRPNELMMERLHRSGFFRTLPGR